MPGSNSKRRLRRFFSSEPLPAPGSFFHLSSEETRHLRISLRFKKGDECLVVDPEGREACARIVKFTSDDKTLLEVEALTPREPREAVWILRMHVALPQRGKFDIIVEKAQELGVQELIPIETERAIARMGDEDKKSKAGERWRRIAQEAAKQSGTKMLTEIFPVQTLEKALQETLVPGTNAHTIVFHPEGAVDFKEWLEAETPFPQGTRISAFIGPEGGFSSKELSLMESRGAQKVRLGRSILKVDTAFVAAASILKLLGVS